MTSRSLPWPVARLGDVAETALGKMLDKGKSHGWPMVPYLRNVNVQWGRIDTKDIMTMELADSDRSRFGVLPGDLLVCEGGEVGRAAIWREHDVFMAYQKALHRIRDTGALDMTFLRYLLEHYQANGFLGRFSTGSTIAHLPQQQLRNLPILLPDRPVQRHIVDILEEHLSRLDAAEELLKRSRLRVARYSEALLRSSLTGYNLGFPLLEAALPSAESDDGELPSLPVGWRWRRLGEIAEVTGGITKDSKNQGNPEWREVPYLRVANVQRGRLDLSSVSTIKASAAKVESMRLEPGDVLLNEGGDRDKLARGWVWEGQISVCIHQNHVFRARICSGAIQPRLLSWSANTFGGPWAERNGKQTTNLASISMKRIRLMPIPVPPVEMQAQLVQTIEDALLGVDLLVLALDRAQRRQMSLRRALLSAAFSGQLTGRGSDMDRVEEFADV